MIDYLLTNNGYMSTDDKIQSHLKIGEQHITKLEFCGEKAYDLDDVLAIGALVCFVPPSVPLSEFYSKIPIESDFWQSITIPVFEVLGRDSSEETAKQIKKKLHDNSSESRFFRASAVKNAVLEHIAIRSLEKCFPCCIINCLKSVQPMPFLFEKTKEKTLVEIFKDGPNLAHSNTGFK